MKRHAIVLAASSLCLAVVAGFLPLQPRYVISGRVEDPHHLRPANIMLAIGYERDGVAMSYPVTIAENGTYATNTLISAKYVLTLFRDPYSPGRKSTPIGHAIARLDNGDLTNVNITIRPDVTVQGRLRRQQGTPWPSSIEVKACLGEEGLRFADCQIADVAPDGRFVLQNPFGPRVLQVGWVASPGMRHEAPRVLLNGRDVTNIPTDFSANPAADLQVILRAEATPDVTPASRNAAKVKKWAPWIGAAAGAAILGLGVHDEEDLVFIGKLMWVGIGGAAGAGVGWLVGKIAGGAQR